MNKKEAAQALGISERSVERYAAAGKLAARYERGRTGQVLTFEPADVERFKQELETPVARGTTEAAKSRQRAAPGQQDSKARQERQGATARPWRSLTSLYRWTVRL